MKHAIVAILLLLPATCDAGLLFGNSSREVHHHYYNAAPQSVVVRDAPTVTKTRVKHRHSRKGHKTTVRSTTR